MDYDGNDFEGQNHHLAGEESTKISPILRPYDLAKFDLDDSLQGHLRFDSLVENEVFLGISSQEESQWIEDFSRGSSEIEFSSSAAKSCSISRRNNVWYEATSSESVEMLLKSVGQEGMVPGETIIEEPDVCGELGMLTERMESNPKQFDEKEGVMESHSASSPGECAKHFSGLGETSGGGCSVKETLLTQESDRECKENYSETDISINESTNDTSKKDPYVSVIQIDKMCSVDAIASVQELDNQEISKQVHDSSVEGANLVLKDNGRGMEEDGCCMSRGDNMDDQISKGTEADAGIYSLGNSLSFDSKVELVEGHTVQTTTNDFGEPSGLALKEDVNLQVAELGSQVVRSPDSALSSKCDAVVLSKSTEISQQGKRNLHEESLVDIPGDSKSQGDTIEGCNVPSGIWVSSEVGSSLHVVEVRSSSIEKEDNYIVSDGQLNAEASVGNCEGSLSTMQHNNLLNNQFEGSSNDHVRNLPKSNVACCSTELLSGKSATENLGGAIDASRIDQCINAEDHAFPSTSVGLAQICKVDPVSKDGDLYDKQNVAVNVKRDTGLPISSSNVDCNIVCLLDTDKKVGFRPSVEDIKETEVMDPGSENDTSARNEHDVTGQGEELKADMLSGAVLDIDNKEVTKVNVSTEESFLTLEVCLHGPIELGSASVVRKGTPVDSASQLLQETVDKSLPSLENCNEAGQSEQAVISDEVCDEDSKKMEVSAVDCDSSVGVDNVEDLVVPENREEEMSEGNHEISSEVPDVVQVPRGSNLCTEPVPISSVDICCNMGENERGSNEAIALSGLNDCGKTAPTSEGDCSSGPDEANGGSLVVVKCTELSQGKEDRHVEVKGSLDERASVPDITNEAMDKVKSDPRNVTDNEAAKVESSFTFPSVGLSESGPSKDLPLFSTIQTCRTSNIVVGSPLTPGVGQSDSKLASEFSRRSPGAADKENPSAGSKATQRKTRRVSGKATGKENTKKGKQTTPSQHVDKGDKSCSVSMSPSETGQLVQREGLKCYGNVELSSTKPCGVISIPSSTLHELNSSTPPSALHRQPFTDLQQVQLRAQIFVYGSLIQGSPPDEACMISAFGAADGGRTVWEPVWRACVERIQGQKSHSNNFGTPLQSLSGARAADQATKSASHQSKALPSPAGRGSSKNTYSPVNPMIPVSSPLWNVAASSTDGLQSSGSARSPLLDYHQALSSLNPYQTPPSWNFIGQNASWLSQASVPGAWVASPQGSSLDANSRFSKLPITESVKLTPVKESSVSIPSGTKHASLSPVVLSGVTSVSAGASHKIDMKKVTQSLGQYSASPKSRKKKKVPISEDVGQITLLPQTRTESFSPPMLTGHMSTSVIVSTSAGIASKNNTGNTVAAVLPISSITNMRGVDQNAEKKVVTAEKTPNIVEEANLHAEDAAALASAAVNHCQGVWTQLAEQKNSGLISEVEVKLASAAVASAAAAAVAKAAATAAKIASNAALQAKLMANDALCLSGSNNFSQGTAVFPDVNILGTATPASILKGRDGTNCSSSIIVAAREAARKRVEAASAASKHAENLDSIVKAAELAAEAVSQAGKIVAMLEPPPLSELVKAGPEGYWKVSQVSLELGAQLNNTNREQSSIDKVEDCSGISAKNFTEGPISMEIQTMNHVLLRKEIDDDVRVVDSICGSIISSNKDLRGQRGPRASDVAKTIGVVPESEIGPSSAPVVQNMREKIAGTSKGDIIKEGCLIEVFKDGGVKKAAWFSANVLSLKDGNLYVSYTDLQSDEGSGSLKEWLALEGNKAPRIRIAHPVTTMRFDGTRKRRRAALGNYAWSVGDRVDAWVENCWREGVIAEKNAKDETTLTVRFPAEGETLVVRAWNLRPTLIWKDGDWLEWSNSRENNQAALGDTPKEKRLKLGGPVVEGLVKEKMPNKVDLVELGKPEQSHMLPLSANEKLFNVGKHTGGGNKPDTLRTARTGLRKEGSKVIFGVPKPGKKRKFMEVSKHYTAETSSKSVVPTDSVKIAKYLMPQGSGSRGFTTILKNDIKEKQAAESKSKVVKSGKPHGFFSRSTSQKDKFSCSAPNDGTIIDHASKDSISFDKKESEKHNLTELASISNPEGAEGAIIFSSRALPADAPTRVFTSKRERLNKGKHGTSGVRSANTVVKENFYNGNPGGSLSESIEPRRSNRRIQPTSRLLEGLQSSLIISKIPAAHDRSSKTSRGISKGNNHG